MNDAGKQHKRAWEYDAYNFWVKHSILEKIVANNISSKAFTCQQNKTRAIIPEKDEGTISLLGKWLIANGRDRQVVEEHVVAPLKHIRKVRQTPAHDFIDNKYDTMVYIEQNQIVEKAYEAMSCLRIMLSTHPLAKGVEIPEYLQKEKGIVFY